MGYLSLEEMFVITYPVPCTKKPEILFSFPQMLKPEQSVDESNAESTSDER